MDFKVYRHKPETIKSRSHEISKSKETTSLKPPIVVKEYLIFDMAVQSDLMFKEIEFSRMWDFQVTTVPINIGTLGSIQQRLTL